MTTQNTIYTISQQDHTIEIYQDAGGKYRWKAFSADNGNIGSSEQGFATIDQCKANLKNLAQVFAFNFNKNKIPNASVKVIENPTESNFYDAEKATIVDSTIKSKTVYQIPNYFFWLILIILFLSLVLFFRVYF